ncbi:MAG: pilus assembly PilX N-terminal domain-containing protein [Thermoanaerobaculia bacterium]
MRPLSCCHSNNRRERGAALVVAILVLAILTVIGIALMLITSTESRIAANEWSINRAFYSADAGVRWGAVEMTDPATFLRRPEFAGNLLGTVLFGMSSHRFRQGLGFIGTNDIQVRVSNPGRLGRRPYRGGIINEQGARAQYMYAFEVRATGGQDDAFLQYSKALVADVEVGPLPARLPF